MYTNIYCLEPFGSDSVHGGAGFSSYNPTAEQCPWPVALLLGAHSKKHVFESTRPLPLPRVGQALSMMDRRLKWAWVFRSNGQVQYTTPLVKKQEVAKCTELVDPAIIAFSNEIKRTVVEHIKGANLVSFKQPRYIRWARRWLVENHLTCRLSDKDGVFVMMEADIFRVLQARELTKSCYRPVGPATVEVAHSLAVSRSYRLATRLDQLGHTTWARQVRNYVCSKAKDVKSILCRWSCTVKTHKGDGQVVMRSIHSSTNHLHNAISEVINRMLEPILRRHRLLCWSTEDVQKKLSTAKVSPRSLFMKFDVKEFFLSGEHEAISTAVASHFEGREKSWIRDATSFVLSTQFVEYSVENELHHQVLEGSGMGMRHSGSISDAAFFAQCEKRLVLENDSLGVEVYARFKDDIFVSLQNVSYIRAFKEALIGGAAPMYRVELESYSFVGVPFLDLQISKRETGGLTFLSWCPYFKPTGRHIPLSSESSHPRSCHRAWPVAEIRRMWSRSSSRQDFLHARAVKLARFQAFFLDESIFRMAESWQPSILPGSGRHLVPCREQQYRIIRLILPFSRRWVGLASKLHVLQSKWEQFLALIGVNIRLQVSFRKGGQALTSIVNVAIAPCLNVYRQAGVFNGR
jgi:hypothetical protein